MSICDGIIVVVVTHLFETEPGGHVNIGPVGRMFLRHIGRVAADFPENFTGYADGINGTAVDRIMGIDREIEGRNVAGHTQFKLDTDSLLFEHRQSTVHIERDPQDPSSVLNFQALTYRSGDRYTSFSARSEPYEVTKHFRLGAPDNSLSLLRVARIVRVARRIARKTSKE